MILSPWRWLITNLEACGGLQQVFNSTVLFPFFIPKTPALVLLESVHMWINGGWHIQGVSMMLPWWLGGYAPAPPATLLSNKQQLTEDGCKRGDAERDLRDIQRAFKKQTKSLISSLASVESLSSATHHTRTAFPFRAEDRLINVPTVGLHFITQPSLPPQWLWHGGAGLLCWCVTWGMSMLLAASSLKAG